MARLQSDAIDTPIPVMDLSKIHLESSASQPESIVLALQGIIGAAGGRADDDDLMAALGVSFMLTVAAGLPCERWPAHGRDAFLEETGALFGLRFRNLHPPDAAVGLQQSAEFAQHFEASYKPLIAAAIANDEPVLAWMGWDSPRANHRSDHWGVITRYDKATGELFGVTPFAAADEVKLTGPAYQLYVLEASTPTDPSPSQLADDVVRRAHIILTNQLETALGILTGPPAFDAWANSFDAVADDENVSSGHARMIVHLHAGRSAAIRFLKRAAPERAEDIVLLLEKQCELVSPFTDASYLSGLLTTPEGQMEFADAIRRCGDLESELAKRFSA